MIYLFASRLSRSYTARLPPRSQIAARFRLVRQAAGTCAFPEVNGFSAYIRAPKSTEQSNDQPVRDRLHSNSRFV